MLVSRNQDILDIVVYTAKASLILGKTGENKEQIMALLARKL
ncbi:KH domain-containing protein [bacterium]|nr:KH domain-containing protein [bacterium]MBT3853368.1 KH domain-containing protein [bacterium]MBT4633493.1 KH domain-containing protein [bacterium]MBT5491078.1 KH domain-containing protein [bacterium]MBT6779151.1 KH domain-containing protein [bacterium]